MRGVFFIKRASQTTRLAASAFALMMLAGPSYGDETPLTVASSIKPLDIIVRHIGGDMVTSSLILPPNQSLHHAGLRPSQRQLIADSDLVFVLDPLMETSLAKLIDEDDAKWEILSHKLAPHIAVRGQAPAADEHHDEHDHDTKHDHHDDHHDERHNDHHEGDAGHDAHDSHDAHDAHDAHKAHGGPMGEDYHFFFSPRLMQEIGHVVADRFAAARPNYAAQFEANFAQLETILRDIQHEMAHELEISVPNHFIAMHDVSLYLEADLPITATGFILTHNHSKPSARHLRDLQEAAKKDAASCIFYEPQLSKRLVSQLSSDMNLPLVTLDPLGSGLAKDASLTDYWRSIATALEGCFKS